LQLGQGYHDFQLPDSNILRLRLVHPDRAEQITGADIIYERHVPRQQRVSIVGVQYKIWDDKSLYLSDERMQRQLARMKEFFCDAKLCQAGSEDHTFRFPFCGAFLRPTDRLQNPNQKLRTTGEHLPIRQIDKVKRTGVRDGEMLSLDSIRHMSLSHHVFENLFTSGKIGSRTISYDELETLYAKLGSMIDQNRILIHAQDLTEGEEQLMLLDGED